jgi:hypothetical protein
MFAFKICVLVLKTYINLQKQKIAHMMERQAGDRWAYVLHNDGGPVCWHQRRLLGTVASLAHKVVVATPDDDVYIESLGQPCNDIQAVRYSASFRPPPPGIPRASVYRFRAEPGPNDLGRWTALAQADMPRWRKNLRTANGLVMMLAIPVLAAGFGIVDPQNTRHFVLTWMLATGLLSLVLILAMIDVLASSVYLWRVRREASRHAVEARMLLLEQTQQASNASAS